MTMSLPNGCDTEAGSVVEPAPNEQNGRSIQIVPERLFEVKDRPEQMFHR